MRPAYLCELNIMNTNEDLNTAGNRSTTDAVNIKLRTECPVDAEAVRSVLLPWVLAVETKSEPLEYDGNLLRSVDAESTFKLCPGAPSVEELRYILDAVPNAHYAADTIELAETYTGEREPRHAWTGAVKRPSRQALSAVLDAVSDRQRVLEAELERMQKAYRTLRAMHDLGNRWTPPSGDGSSAGWIALVQKPGTDLSRLVVVEAPSLADVRSSAKQEREVNKRLTVING